jgi:AcrR family transcriptional regulator
MSSPQAPAKSRMNAAQRRAAIVDTAIELFANRGFRGTTTRELAAAVGVSEPVLYQHFETKRALYDAILEGQCGGQEESIVEEIESLSKAGEPRAFFTRLASGLLDWYLVDPRYARLLMFSSLEKHELADLFYARHVAMFYQVVTPFIERQIAEGRFRAMDAMLAARIFSGMVAHQGVIYSIYCPGELQGSRDEVVRSVVDIFLNGMSA